MSREGSSAAEDLGRQLQKLGDPSGRQDSHYWNDWFQAVSNAQNHRPFEWYCDVHEVMRVVEHHARNSQTDSLSMIHPGSGTSLVPFKLLELFPSSRQVIVDVSDVALEEIKKVHAAFPSKGVDDCSIQYVLADLLDASDDQSEWLRNSAFDCWIDKGFVDAIFAKDGEENDQQSSILFQKCLQLLKNNENGGGFAVIISIAEHHSLQIIVDNWLASICTASTCVDHFWEPNINVWELVPISGDKPPVAIVLTKASSKRTCLTGKKEATQNMTVQFFWHPRHGDIEEYNVQQPQILSTISHHVEQARLQFIKLAQEKLHAEQNLLATLEIKPSNLDINLASLADQIRHEKWKTDEGQTLNPQWQPYSDSCDQVSFYKIVPVAFGISKLVMKCLIASDDLDGLVEAIENWRVDDEEEEIIQSVDVDWENTSTLFDVKKLLNVAKGIL